MADAALARAESIRKVLLKVSKLLEGRSISTRRSRRRFCTDRWPQAASRWAPCHRPRWVQWMWQVLVLGDSGTGKTSLMERCVAASRGVSVYQQTYT